MTVLSAAILFVLLGRHASAIDPNPFPFPIAKGSAVADVKKFAQLPNAYGGANGLFTSPDGRIFVTCQYTGIIHYVSADGNAVTPYLELTYSETGLAPNGSEEGLESLAFHPDFLKPGAKGYGVFYTALTTPPGAPMEKPADFIPPDDITRQVDHVVLEWHAADPMASTFTPAHPEAPFREVLRVGAPAGNHTIGLVAFNPTGSPGDADYGMLYIGFGDGGYQGDPWLLAQDTSRPFGKILRIDPMGSNSANGKYGVPADNPFVGVSGVLGEIWATGLRNPQRYSWDLGGAHRMFIADIGQDTVEEINLGAAGANYGWSEREGSFDYRSGNTASLRGDAATTGYTYPIAEYDHSEGVSITAGFVYRGADLPGLQGKFLFGDIATGRVFYLSADQLPAGGSGGISEMRLRFDGIEMTIADNIRSERVDLRFGRDLNGRIFLLNKHDAWIRVLVAPSPSPSPTPTAVPAAIGVIGQPGFESRSAAFDLAGLRFPCGVAYDSVNDKIYVSDAGNARVLRYPGSAGFQIGAAAEMIFGQPQPDQHFKNNGGISAKSLASPIGLRVDGQGTLWVTDSNNNRVLGYRNAKNKHTGDPADIVLGPANFTSSYPSSLSSPRDVAIDSAGNLWLSNSWSCIVSHFGPADQIAAVNSSSTGHLGTLYEAGVSAMKMSHPEGIWPDGDRLWVSDPEGNRILRFDRAATRATPAGGAAANAQIGQTSFDVKDSQLLWYPTNLCLDNSGTLWVSDQGNGRVVGFKDAANLEGLVAPSLILVQRDPNNPEGVSSRNVTYPGAICPGPQNTLLVVDGSNNRVLAFKINGPKLPPPAPKLAVKDGKKRTTTARQLKLHGTTTGAVTRIVAMLGHRNLAVKGISSWRLTASPLQTGRNPVTVKAFGPGGSSTPARVIVIRKKR